MFSDNIFLTVLFILFGFTALVQLFYYLWFYLAVHLRETSKDVRGLPPVSVIICARNEAVNLGNFLPSVLEQDYPDYEVIVVNDCSEDNSYEILGQLIGRYPHLRVSNVNKDPKFTHNKKFAQFIGIKAAKNEILVFTDADCKPESAKWLQEMASSFDDRTDFVLGYGGYIKNKGLLNRYLRYDCAMIAMQYFGMAIRGIPYMGVGRNLAYRRSLFFEKKGFGAYNHVISGDDDLFVNSNADRRNCNVEYSYDSHTRSLPSSTFRQWVNQKQRHFTTAPYYKFSHKFLLILEPASRILFYVSFIVLVSNLFLWQYALGIFGLRLIIQLTVATLVMKKLNEPGLAGYSVFFDIFSPLINGVIILSSMLKRPGRHQWK
jgi:cellulose synthase/poly-beta-1,6-N-acetylglucosamine synthase-like glycosyltransferase